MTNINICDSSLIALGGVCAEKNPKKSKKHKKLEICEICSKVVGRSIKRKKSMIFKRAFSEIKLLEILEHDFNPDYTYHCISGGDIDSLSYLKHILRQQSLEYCLLSTWCMANDDVQQIREWVEVEKIKRLDCYCGEIFPRSYSEEFKDLSKVVDLCGGRVCIFKNHSKIFAGVGEKFSFVVESSANINTNPRTENTVISFGDDIFNFYKDFFDGVISFNKGFEVWTPWQK